MNVLKKLLVGKQSSIGSAAFVLMATVLASRILGLLRDRLLAGTYSPEHLGIYFAAFRLPNMIFDLLVAGVLTTAFIPIFTRLLTQKGEKIAWQMASTIINYSILVFVFFAIPIFFFADKISVLLAPGFLPEEQALMANFTRVMILFQVLPLLLGNFITGMLQSYQLFLIPALAPIVYNVGTIIGIIFFSSMFGLWAPVIGIIIGAFFFLMIQIPALLYLRYSHTFSLDNRIEGVRETGKLMIPRTIGLGVSQIETTIDLTLASILGTKMITVFSFAQHLQQLPIGLFGATIAQAALPTFSRSAAHEGKNTFRSDLITAIHQILFFVLPLSVFFIVLRIPITRLVFGSNEFDWEATVLTGQTLATFSISLCAQSLIQLLARAFYALYDTKTPVIVGIVSIVINVFFSLLFVVGFGWSIWALGLSTSIAMIIHAGILFHVLQQRIGRFSFKDIIVTPGKIGFVSFIMGGIIFILQRLLDQLVFDTTRTINLVLLVGMLGFIGGGVYLFLSWVFGVDQLDQFWRLLRKVKKFQGFLLASFFPPSGPE